MAVLSPGRRGAAVRLASIVAGLALAVPASPAGARPDDGAWALLEEAHEIIDIATVLTQPELPVATYKSAGDNEIPDELWPDYLPPPPYIKNTTRNLQFNESQFLASPGEPVGTTAYVTTSDGYTWAAMSMAINALWPYDPAQYSDPTRYPPLATVDAYYAGNLVVTPPPGVVKVTANYKGQNMKFWANEGGARSGPGAVPLDRYFVTDEWGNEYIMHASGELDQNDVAQAFEAAVLPLGWTKSVRRLKRDLILTPAEGADGSFHYLVWRDSADNTYHQTGWSRTGSLAAQIAGMPIWGGQGRDVLAGDMGGVRDDLIHAAGGNDTLRPGFGDDEVWCDAGVDTVVLPGRRSDHTVVDRSADATELVLAGAAGTKTLRDCELVRFDDRTVAVKALR
ncbi:MAG TPA: hypothetical protein VFG47_08805 [Geminicoccaceae bacterium]|nr:hypothetical protein [Geminicoccaceae bacterium]